MTGNRALVFKNVPSGLPVAGKDFAVETIAAYDGSDPAAACPDNGVFLKSLYSSIDPYQRGRMRVASVKSYSPPLGIGEPFSARGIAEVLHSKVPTFKVGDLVVGMLPIQEFTAMEESQLLFIKVLDNPLGIEDTRVYLGTLGIPGLTAYGGLYEIGRPERGQTILVSAASGAVGQMVGQLARLEGLRTIGSVGSDDKLDYIVNELGFDTGFNYKKESPAEALARLAPEGLDIYFDNVGGGHLDTALAGMKDFGRVVMCGTIAEYNAQGPDERHPMRNTTCIFSKRLTVRGFVVSDKGIADRYAGEHQERVQRWIKDGTIKTKTWEVEGVENAPDAFLALFSGKNFGKVVLKY